MVLSYVKKTDKLKVAESGSGGLKEMLDEVEDSKVQYYFASVIDPKTKLPKVFPFFLFFF